MGGRAQLAYGRYQREKFVRLYLKLGLIACEYEPRRGSVRVQNAGGDLVSIRHYRLYQLELGERDSIRTDKKRRGGSGSVQTGGRDSFGPLRIRGNGRKREKLSTCSNRKERALPSLIPTQ